METLLRWIHISDIHMGHGDTAYVWDQRLVLRELVLDVARQLKAQPEPPVDAILVTGDIANTGAGRAPDEYAGAAHWLAKVGDAANVPPARIFVVPGNHDVDRGADRDAAVKALVTALREGTTSLDDALADPARRALLARRMERYLSFAGAFGPPDTPDRLFWAHRLVARSGLPVRLVGLDTALLAAGDDDHGKLRVGMTQVAHAFEDVKDDELVLALGHHPLRGGWLADEAALEPWVKRHVHALLTGHVHEADAEESRSGAGDTFVRVVAGSAHGDRMPPGIPAGHGYSFGAVVRTDGGHASLRVTPRRWSAKNAVFRPDVDNVPEDRTFSEHPLPSLRLPAAVAASAPRGAAPRAPSKIVPGEAVPVFISAAPEDDALRGALQRHLSGLRRGGKVVLKHSQEAPAGSERAAWIAARIDEARIVLLLISPDYVGADDYYEDELLRAVERHERGDARVIPIFLRAYSVSGEPFAELQALPRDGVPVDRAPGGQDAVLAGVAHEIGLVVAEMRGEPPPPARR